MVNDLGRVNARTGRAYARDRAVRRRSGRDTGRFVTVARRDRPDVEDRQGRRKGLVHPDGRAYSPCPNPQCLNRSMIVAEELGKGDAVWICQACGYSDNSERALV